jgi:hypothetical protein
MKTLSIPIMATNSNLNNMLRAFWFTVFVSIFVSVSGQKFSIDFSAGYSVFALDDLDKFNSYLLKELPFEAKLTDSFPNNIEYKISPILKLEKKFSIGLRWTNTSTGSRINVNDYSGGYTLDAVTSVNTYGAVVNIGPFELHNFSLYLNNNFGQARSKLTYTEQFSLYEQSSDTSFSFKSKSNYYEPTVQLFYNLGICEFGLSCGYFFDFKSTYTSTTDSKNSLEIYGEKMSSDWSGMRYSFIIKVKPFYFRKKNS